MKFIASWHFCSWRFSGYADMNRVADSKNIRPISPAVAIETISGMFFRFIGVVVSMFFFLLFGL